jgi:iron-sulfur cluster repair protein YtfE (RIC family)
MNQMSDRIVAHHEEILDALDSLSAAVIADAEGSHRFRLTGFLRHRLLRHIHDEERNLYGLVDRLLPNHCMNSTAAMANDHRFVEEQVSRIDAALMADRLENLRGSARHANRAELERLLVELNAVLRLHLQKEKQVYVTVLRCCAADQMESEVLRRMQRVFDEKAAAAPSESAPAAYREK